MNATALPVVAAVLGDRPERCELLGPFALFVQGALGALALLVLLWKRAREHPQRPLLVWFMDVSKQVIGASLVHVANLLLSMLSSGSFTTEPSPHSLDTVAKLVRRHEGEDPDDPEYHSNPCSFYLLNLAIDTTLGVVILIYTLRVLHKIVETIPIPGLRTGITSGYYGDPPQWKYWAKQAAIYFWALMIMKFFVWVIFAVFPWLGRVGDWLLAWTEGNRQLQVFFVMFFFPLIMNAFQYYVIDSFIKHQDPSQTVLHDAAPISDDASEPGHPRHSLDYDSDSDHESDGGRRLLSSHSRKGPDEYDPALDGSFNGLKPPTIGSQRSRNSSMMLLPGSRGPSTPGYDEEQGSIRTGRTSQRFMDDESTLVDGRESR